MDRYMTIFADFVGTDSEAVGHPHDSQIGAEVFAQQKVQTEMEANGGDATVYVYELVQVVKAERKVIVTTEEPVFERRA